MTTLAPLPKASTPCADVDPELFFPEKGQNPLRAKAVCNGTDTQRACPILSSCLQWALKHERDGVWGGMSAQEREKLRALKKIRVERVQYGDLVAPTPSRPGHGSWSGVNEHRVRNERNCAACREFTTRQSKVTRERKATEGKDTRLPTTRPSQRVRVSCPDCGKGMTRKSLWAHKRDACPKRKIPA